MLRFVVIASIGLLAILGVGSIVAATTAVF